MGVAPCMYGGFAADCVGHVGYGSLLYNSNIGVGTNKNKKYSSLCGAAIVDYLHSMRCWKSRISSSRVISLSMDSTLVGNPETIAFLVIM